MAFSNWMTALCVTTVLVTMAMGPVSSVSIWSRLRDILDINSAIAKRHIPDSMMDNEHGVKMGVSNIECDDGEHGIGIDWDGSDETVIQCVQQEKQGLKTNADPINIYEAKKPSRHECLNEEIEYGTDLPLSGPHRPLWPMFGEYRYLPPQRWVHSLEHGAVALLYHPCSNPSDLKRLKEAVRGCLTKYVISPYRDIPQNMPFALLAFQNARLISNANDMSQVYDFIEEFALQGPETRVTEDGQYTYGLEKGVETITNEMKCQN